MSDVVVTVPKDRWFDWITEGDAAGEPGTGEEWGFFQGGSPPCDVRPGERVYIVSHGRLRGYALLVRIQRTPKGFAFVRKAGAVAVTIPETIVGFRGWRVRWWDRAIEVPFLDWRTAGVVAANEEDRMELLHLASVGAMVKGGE